MGRRLQRLVVVPNGGALVVDSLSLSGRDGETYVLAPEFVGICGTDLDIIARSRSDKAVVLGHEAVVRIIGQPSAASCESSCEASYLINPVNAESQDQIIGHSEEGMLQDVAEIPASTLWDGLLVAIPPDLDPLLAVITEPLGAAIYSIELLTATGLPERLLVVGAGPMGLLTAVAARLLGVPEVAVIDRSKQRIRYAVENKFVADDHAMYGGSDLFSLATTLYEGTGPDAVALCVGREQRRSAFRDAIRLASSGARIDLTTGFAAGETLSEIPGVDVNGIRRRNVCGRPRPGHVEAIDIGGRKLLYLTGHRGTSQLHLANAMKMLLDYPSIFRKFITDVVTLEEAPKAIESLLRERRELSRAPYRKVVVSPRSF